jgi:hypothetical protein
MGTAMLKSLWQIAAALLFMPGAIAQGRSGNNEDAGKMQCFAVLVVAASKAKQPDQKLFEKPEFLETVAKCNTSPEPCRQAIEEIKEKRWPMPEGLTCRD